MRYASVHGGDSVKQVGAYLPDNYSVVAEAGTERNPVFVIAGEDHCGWTLDDYVIPRFASGLMGAKEIFVADCDDLFKHEIFKAIGEAN